MKKVTSFLTVLVVLVSVLSLEPSYAKPSVRLQMDGVFYDEYQPVIRNGSTLVPVGFISRQMGFVTEWIPKEKKVVIKGDPFISLFIGNRTAYVGAEKKLMQNPAQIINSKTYVPVAFVAEVFQIPVSWDSKTRVVSITRGNAAPTPPPSGNSGSFPNGKLIKGNIKSNVIRYPSSSTKHSILSIDLFKTGEEVQIDFMGGDGKPGVVIPSIYWKNMRRDLVMNMNLPEIYDKGRLVQNANMELAIVDLDKDGNMEILVVVHDGIIDGMFALLKPHSSRVLADGTKVADLYNDVIYSGWFQKEVVVEKNGHLIMPFGSQGLFEEYILQDGELKLIYSPSYGG